MGEAGNREKGRAYFGLIVLALLTGCEHSQGPVGPILCTLELIYGVRVDVVDDTTGEPLSQDTSGRLIDGSYREEMLRGDGTLVGAPERDVPRQLGWLASVLVPVATAMVVTGAFVTAAGPHSGGADIGRLGNLEDALYVHVRAAAVFGIGFLLLFPALVVLRRRARSELMLSSGLLVVLVIQMIIGEIQWRNQLPWELVLVHVALATAVLAAAVALAGRLVQRASALPLPQMFTISGRRAPREP